MNTKHALEFSKDDETQEEINEGKQRSNKQTVQADLARAYI